MIFSKLTTIEVLTLMYNELFRLRLLNELIRDNMETHPTHKADFEELINLKKATEHSLKIEYKRIIDDGWGETITIEDIENSLKGVTRFEDTIDTNEIGFKIDTYELKGLLAEYLNNGINF